MIGKESVSDTDRQFLVVRVATTDGGATDHIYSLRDAASAPGETNVDLVLAHIWDAFTGTTPFLRLANPDVLYNPEHVVRVALEVISIEESAEESEERGPIGFRPP